MRKRVISIIGLGLIAGSVSFACTTIMVGKDATSDGSVIVARNNDQGDAKSPEDMYYHSKMSAGTVFNSNQNDFSYTFPKETLSYTAFPIWSSLTKPNKSYEEAGINSRGVAMTATETIFASAQALKVNPYILKTGLTEDSLTSVILSQATSAKEGIELLGKLIDKYGSAEGFGVGIIDSHSAWYLENAGGYGWLAERVPNDKYFVSANEGRFQEINPNDPENYLYSKDLITFAEKNGLYDPSKGKFDFFKCYVRNEQRDVNYNYVRVEELQKILSNYSSTDDSGEFPVFLKPTNKLSVEDIKSALRNHYDGTENDPYENVNPLTPYRPISVLRGTLDHIIVTRDYMPKEIGDVMYVAWGMSLLSPYIPFYYGLKDQIPTEYATATENADSSSIYWMNRKLQSLVFLNFPLYAPDVIKAINQFESTISDNQKSMEDEYLKIYKVNPVAAHKLIVDFTNKTIESETDLLNSLSNNISDSLGINKDLPPSFYETLLNYEQSMYHFEGA